MKRPGVVVFLLILQASAAIVHAQTPVRHAAASFSPSTGRCFGCAVAVDGDLAVVGDMHYAAPDNDPVAQGAAYVLRFNGTAWVEEQKLELSAADRTRMAERGARALFGASVSVRGTEILVGAPGFTLPPVGITVGAVFVYRHDGNAWVETQVLMAEDSPGGRSFGRSIARDGDWLVAGDPGDNVQGSTDTGSAYLFEEVDGTWVRRQKLIDSHWQTFAEFGESVAISGSVAAVGTLRDEWQCGRPILDLFCFSGAVYVYRYDGTAWQEEAKLTPSMSDAAPDDHFGTRIATTTDVILAGAPGTETGKGAAYLFGFDGQNWQYVRLTASDGRSPAERGFSVGDWFGASVALEPDVALIGATYANSDRGAVYEFRRIGNAWNESSRLVDFPTDVRRAFGVAVAVRGTAALVGAPSRIVADNGAVHFYDLTPNASPVADDQSLSTPEDTPALATLTGTDANGDPLTFHIIAPPSHGTLSGTAPNLTYTPAADYFGPDSFTFTANDGQVDGNTGTVSISVTAVNDAPVARSQSVTIDEDTLSDATLTAADADADALSYVVLTFPAHGTLTGSVPNVTYTPAPNYFGTDSFSFKARDGQVDSNTAMVSIDVRPVNDAPFVDPEPPAVIDEGTAFSRSGSFSDPDPDTWNGTIDYGDGSGTQPLSIDGNKAFAISHVYRDNGSYTVAVTVADGGGASGTAVFAVTVNNVAPLASNLALTPNPVAVGGTLSASVSFTDAGVLDTHAVQWSWGDGTTAAGTVVESNGSGAATGSHISLQRGRYIVTATIIDKDGGSAALSATYMVAYNFSGFLAPVSLGKPFKLGSTIPVKFQLTDANGNVVPSAVATTTIQKFSGTEPVGDPIETISTSSADVGNTFRYSSLENQYIYNLNTRPLSQGLWQIRVALDDGTVREAFLALK